MANGCRLQAFLGELLERATQAEAKETDAALLVCQLHEQEERSHQKGAVIEQLVSEVETLGGAGMAFAAR